MMAKHHNAIALSIVILLSFTACRQTDLGEGGSAVKGSGGSAGTQGGAKELIKCDTPVATVALAENPRGYGGYMSRYGLPESPVPLVSLLLQQSGCFRVVDRLSGLNATMKEKELSDQGLTRPENTIKKSNVLEAQYSVVPNLVFSETNAGEGVAGIMSAIPVLRDFAGAASHVKFKEAQVVLFLTDNETTEQLGSAEGSARATDLGAGGLLIGKLGGKAGMGWGNTNEGKVIAAAFLDSVNKLVPQIRVLAAKQLPPPVATKADATAGARITKPASK